MSSKRYTEQDVEDDLAGKMADELTNELKYAKLIGESCPPKELPVFEAGVWLGEKLREMGVEKKEISSRCFALGQRIRMAGIENSYREAIKSLERWEGGNPDYGGLELGLEPIKGIKQINFK